MECLRKDVMKLVNEELERANDMFPMFHSDHEGLAVILEERDEVRSDYVRMRECANKLMESVFKDEDRENKTICANALALNAVYVACEAVQTAAMAIKFIRSANEREGKNE